MGSSDQRYPEIKLLIGGAWRSRPGAPVLNPADESVIGTVPHATRQDLEDAVEAADQGFKVWRRTSPAKRAEIILKACALMRERVEELAVVMTLELTYAAEAPKRGSGAVCVVMIVPSGRVDVCEPST